MNRKNFARLSAVVLACVMLFGTLLDEMEQLMEA